MRKSKAAHGRRQTGERRQAPRRGEGPGGPLPISEQSFLMIEALGSTVAAGARAKANGWATVEAACKKIAEHVAERTLVDLGLVEVEKVEPSAKEAAAPPPLPEPKKNTVLNGGEPPKPSKPADVDDLLSEDT